MRASILAKLIAAYLIPTLVLIAVSSLVGYNVARESLEDEVGKRLVGHASAVSASLKPDLLLTLQHGDEATRTFRNIRSKLEALRKAANAERIYVCTPDHKLIVGAGQGADLPIGSPFPSLERDRHEVEQVLKGEPTPSSITFKGIDGKTYKSGYSPVLDAGGNVVAIVGADASAQFFEVLRRFGSSMAMLALACGVTGLAIFFVIGKSWIVRPIAALLASAREIGMGNLSSPVPSVGRDELALLAKGLEEMRVQLACREHEMQMMLAGIAHEVRNPLGGMELFAGLLAEDLQSDENKLVHVRRIQRELSHLKQVVEDFLGWARKPKLTTERFDLLALLQEIQLVLAVELESKKQSLSTSCVDRRSENGAQSVDSLGSNDKLPAFANNLLIEADATALRRAILNLLINSIQATPSEGHIVVRAEGQVDTIVISIEDDGPGIPEEHRQQLFAPFFTTKEKGLGLGLAFVKRIAEAHGGSVRLEGSSQGARFVLELPRTPRENGSSRSQSLHHSSQTNRRITA